MDQQQSNPVQDNHPQQQQQYRMQQQNQEYYPPDDEQYKIDYQQDQQYQYQYEDMEELKSNKLQYQMKQLTTKIIEQTNQLNVKLCLSFDWALLLYYLCEWRTAVCQALLLTQDQQHKKKICYNDVYIHSQGYTVQDQMCKGGICEVCTEQYEVLVRNICGHEYCSNCWVGNLIYHMDKNQKQPEPFPRCMELNCQTRMSYTVIQLISQPYPEVNDKYYQVLCRNYATRSQLVKVCKGRLGINCNRCFKIQKLFGVIECQNCGNLVCPRCGQRSHGSTQCQFIRKWRIVNQTTAGFIQYFNLQTCPNCQRYIERIAGCNQIACRCGQKFCYVCGEKWELTHAVVDGLDYCPNYRKVIDKYKRRRALKKKIQGNVKVCFRLEDKREYLYALDKMFQRAENRKIKLGEIIKIFLLQFQFHQSELRKLQKLCDFLKRATCLIWGEQLCQYFLVDKKRQFYCEIIKNNINIVYDFVFTFVEGMYNLLIQTTPPPKIDEQLWLKEREQKLSSQNRLKFFKTYFDKIKELDKFKINTMKIAHQQLDCQIFEEEII